MIRLVCPKCGKKLQFSLVSFFDIDPVNGQPIDAELEEVVDIYCESDCFIIEDTDMSLIDDSDELMRMVTEAID